MKKKETHSFFYSNPFKIIWILGFLFLFLSNFDIKAEKKPEDILVQLSRQTNTIYNILNQVTRQTGYFFIYDSDIVDSDKEIRIGRTQTNLLEFISELVPEPELEIKVIDNHILIYKHIDEKTVEKPIPEKPPAPEHITLNGRVLDGETGEPLPYSAINIKNSSRGVTTNANGIFKLRLSEKYNEDTLTFSYLGYKSRSFPISILKQGFTDIALDFKHITLQEVVISSFDPLPILEKALKQKTDNYPDKPTNYISFYREGIFIEDDVMLYSEAVLKEYKPPIHSQRNEQISMLQSRSFSNIKREDTLVFRLKAGLEGASQMDVIKNIPDFLDDQLMRYYVFTPAGIISLEDTYAYVIEFKQKEHIRLAMHKGTIYVDKDSYAIISIDFEINRNYIRSITSRFIPNPSPNYAISIQGAEYIVSYKYYKGKYHLNHVKGELQIRVRPRRKLFGRSYRIFFEKATVQIETEDVQRLRRRETIRKNIIFSDHTFIYDHDFWGDHNIITPEKEISEALKRIDHKIESLVFE